MIDVWQYSEYALDFEYDMVLKVLGLHKVLSKIFHQGSEYASSSEYTSVTRGSVENSPSYMFDRFLSIPWALILLGLEYARAVNMPRFCVNNILKILSILKVTSC